MGIRKRGLGLGSRVVELSSLKLPPVTITTTATVIIAAILVIKLSFLLGLRIFRAFRARELESQIHIQSFIQLLVTWDVGASLIWSGAEIGSYHIACLVQNFTTAVAIALSLDPQRVASSNLSPSSL